MESGILLARIDDLVELVYRTDKPKYLGFLSNEEKDLAQKHLKKRGINVSFFGGAEDNERVFLGCFPEWVEQSSFPITALTFKFRNIDSLRHRDFLGSLMALGLKREAIGDILIEQGRAVVFLSDDIVKYVFENLNKVGNVGVNACIGFNSPLPERNNCIEKTVTVASLRLDCVVSAVCDFSRNTACDYIESGLVSVNSILAEKTTKVLTDGDVLSVRRKGKFQIVSSNRKTKKDRIILIYKSY